MERQSLAWHLLLVFENISSQQFSNSTSTSRKATLITRSICSVMFSCG
jgi:hypothetical protein